VSKRDEASATFLVYSRADAKRLAHISRNPRVAFNLDGNGKGGDIIVIIGEARLCPDNPPAYQLPVCVEKYRMNEGEEKWGRPLSTIPRMQKLLNRHE